ncbi:CvpA family protein [Aerophototrophica crusticola]|uniref:CvpA family protein n=1 Tax=Aerophototrophica crusticola TaxID=1709002 RepID=A0A858R5R0_9PROT|nr:CvpA family protein [Rhodospirillaceae bacterium B3]
MDGNGLNPVDVAVIVIVLLSALMAFARGFAREVLSIAAWIGAAFATLWAFPHAAPVARQYIGTQIIADGAAVLGVFTVALIAFSMLTHAVSGRVQDSGLSAIDRSLGFAFGAVRGAAVVSLAFMFSQWLWPDTPPDWLANARTRPLMAAGAETIRGLLPDTTLDPAQRAAREAQEQARRAMEAKQALERLSNPAPAGATKAGAPAADQGYNGEALGRLDQLIKNTDTPDPQAPQPTPAGR